MEKDLSHLVMARLVVSTGDKPDVRAATDGPDEPGHDGDATAFAAKSFSRFAIS
jgi:hypothetical protein